MKATKKQFTEQAAKMGFSCSYSGKQRTMYLKKTNKHSGVHEALALRRFANPSFNVDYNGVTV